VILIPCYGRLGLALESATTVPTATAAPTSRPTLITNDRERFCLAGAMAAPAGLEAAIPLAGSDGAAAVPMGPGGALCCCEVLCELFCGGAGVVACSGAGAGLSGKEATSLAPTVAGLAGSAALLGAEAEADGAGVGACCAGASCADAATPRGVASRTTRAIAICRFNHIATVFMFFSKPAGA
jgi:hypothetical protein